MHPVHLLAHLDELLAHRADDVAHLHRLTLGRGQNAGVDQVHILQCDTEVSVEEFIDVDALTAYRIQGLGGSDMSPAMMRLADDFEVTAVVVLTDGYIAYPQEPPPYRVLWVVPEPYQFQPPYGEVLFLRP